jgi:two-component system sensor histidine kinase BaeS
VVAVFAIGATAWLAVQTTSAGIAQERGQAITSGNTIYEDLLGYAAEHPDWRGVGETVTVLAQETGRRIVLTDPNRKVIVDSAPDGGALPATASAGVDPLSVDPSLVSDAGPDRISRQAVGPFMLTDTERDRLDTMANGALNCVQQRVGAASIMITASGRPSIESPSALATAQCSLGLSRLTATESVAIHELDSLVNGCLNRQGLPSVKMNLDFSWTMTSGVAPAQPGFAPSDMDQRVQDCVTTARREQLTPYVASAALLFVITPDDVTPTAFDLSTSNKTRIALAVGSVLLLTIAITVVAGRRFTRPLRAVTAAAQRMRAGDVTTAIRVRRHDEIGRLADAFNDMAAHRAEVERLRTDLISDIAHELRTPLSNIRGWLEATQDGLSQPDEALISSLLEEAMMLHHIIDDLQDLAMADAGTLRLHPEPVSVPDLLIQIRTAHRTRAERAGVTLSIAIDGDLELWADPVRLRQMLDNLVTNAIRHTPGGGTVTACCHADGRDTVIEVTDTGSGISVTDLPRVFDRFWRAEKSRSRQTGGSGLGLAIVRKLAEAHGGSIRVASMLGAGSTFTLRLPPGKIGG